ncbi:AZL_007920/MXAN_0976 family protein [Leptospira broomii serovar Hurstbridge str. 5399]|uniref:AZL_007920/MXAN_0976 family protein n=1 Tax=Leptospira broomii serovar Hurstbridge str. 5399 TaxID=1049789 RepID=T0FBB9_9LEPT|nr:MbnP family copper-binding protein [Leptospira broomii]EQA45161.1 AZL_007920/MXAN_0976 family protein [Leptospira broomii serovar Hurstbridge str. 5399]
MFFLKTTIRALLLTSSVTFLGNCNGNTEKSNMPLLLAGILASSSLPGIHFKAMAGSSLLQCGKDISGHAAFKTNATESFSEGIVRTFHIAEIMPISLKDLRLYVSNLTLIEADGSETKPTLTADGKWQNTFVTLLDFENLSGDCIGTTDMNSLIKIPLPNKLYKGIRFEVGVPEEFNHQNPALANSPLNVSGLAWSWAMGYRFLVAEFVSHDPTANGNTAVFHLGSGGCSMSAPYACSRPNRAVIDLQPAGGYNPMTQSVKLDLKALVNGWDIRSGNVSCHSESSASCVSLFANLGIDPSTGNLSGTQSVFSISNE